MAAVHIFIFGEMVRFEIVLYIATHVKKAVIKKFVISKYAI